MLVAIGTLVTLFRSFTAYQQGVRSADEEQLLRQETQLSLSGLQFGAAPPSTPTNFDVAASAACGRPGIPTTATGDTDQGKLFYAAGYWWDFFICNNAFSYSSSPDGFTWSAPAPVAGSPGPAGVSGTGFAAAVQGSTVFVAMSNLNKKNYVFNTGTLGAGTIAWAAAYNAPTAAAVDGPISIEADGAGNAWVAAVEGAYSIAVYEHLAGCAPNQGWEPSTTCVPVPPSGPGNFAPGALSSLTASAMPLIAAPPEGLASTGAVLLYETGGASANSTGSISVITQGALGSASWNSIPLSGVGDYSLTGSSAALVGNVLCFAGLESASAGANTGVLDTWRLAFSSISSGTNSPQVTLESTTYAWQGAVTASGSTVAVFDSPSSTTVRYFVSPTEGSTWSQGITLVSSEGGVNGLSPAEGGFGVTWTSDNPAPNVRFASLSQVGVTNLSPFPVHLVDLFVVEPSTQRVAMHFYSNSTLVFDYWVPPGETVALPFNLAWSPSAIYTVTVGADDGVTAAVSGTSPA
jgi:hypothetical protein